MPISSEFSRATAEVRLPEHVDLHARPAASFVRAAMQFSARISVASEQREADAKSLLSVLALGAKRGTALRLTAEGDGAAGAVETLAATITDLAE